MAFNALDYPTYDEYYRAWQTANPAERGEYLSPYEFDELHGGNRNTNPRPAEERPPDWDDPDGRWDPNAKPFYQYPDDAGVDPGVIDPGLATPGGGGGGTAGSGGWGYLTEPFLKTPPKYQRGPQYEAPDPFSFDAFNAPTAQSVFADPSYQFRFDEGARALEQSAAAQGRLRTGGTLKDFINYGQQAASQEYGNIFNRALTSYATNYGVARDAWDRLMDRSQAVFQPQQREHELMQARNWDRFLAEGDIFERNRRRAGDYLFGAAGVGAGAV